MKLNKIAAIARTATLAAVASALALGLASGADAATGTMYGDPAAAAEWWRHQQYDDCVLMSSADVVGQYDRKGALGAGHHQSGPNDSQHRAPRLDLRQAG
jgi:hypothetical protein